MRGVAVLTYPRKSLILRKWRKILKKYQTILQSYDLKILIKFADDSTIQGLLCDSEDCYFEEVKCFVGWYEKNFLMLNVKKTNNEEPYAPA